MTDKDKNSFSTREILHYPEGVEVENSNKPKRGRPATGRTTKIIRVPLDFDEKTALNFYYNWLPVIEEYRSIAEENPQSVRNEKLIKLLQELGH